MPPSKPTDVPDDGRYHGPELDVAMEAANKLLPHDLGVCETAFSTRKDPIIDQTLREGMDPEHAAGLKKALMDSGQPFDDDLVSTIQIRGAVGGAFSYGISTGILLERQRLRALRRGAEVIGGDQVLVNAIRRVEEAIGEPSPATEEVDLSDVRCTVCNRKAETKEEIGTICAFVSPGRIETCRGVLTIMRQEGGGDDA